MYWFYTGDSDTDRHVEWRGVERGRNTLICLVSAPSQSHRLWAWVPGKQALKTARFPLPALYAQTQRVIRAKQQAFVNILRGGFAVDTVEDLLRYDGEQLEFRVSALADLPLCADAYDAAQRVTHISADFVAGARAGFQRYGASF